MSKYDIIIIGSGLGGLECGAILSKEGFNVCVVEKNAQFGGCFQTYQRKGHLLDTGIHYVGSLDEGQVMNQYFRYFGIMDKLKIKRLDDAAFDTIYYKGKTYDYAMGYPQFIETICRSFPHEKENLKCYAEQLQAVGNLISVDHLKQGTLALEGMKYFCTSAAHLIAETEGDALVHHRLTAQHVPVVFHGDVDIGEHQLVRLPVKAGAGLFPVGRLLFQAALVSALFKVQIVPVAVPADGGVKIFRGVLRGACAEAVQAEAVFIIFAGIVVVFAACVHLAEDQLPVVALLLLVPVHGAAAAEVLALDALVEIARQCYNAAIARAGLVDGVRQDLEHRVFAALEPVRAEDHRRPFPDPVLALELGYALVAVGLGSVSCHLQFFPH